jgi:uncharacterized protein HemX
MVALVVTGAILLIIGLWAFVQPSEPTEKKDFIQAVGILLAGLVGLGGLYFTWLNLKQTREDTRKQLEQARESIDMQLRQAQDSTDKQLEQARKSQEVTLESTYKTLELTEKGQITERFTRAID